VYKYRRLGSGSRGVQTSERDGNNKAKVVLGNILMPVLKALGAVYKMVADGVPSLI
jgi:hypothetical protein